MHKIFKTCLVGGIFFSAVHLAAVESADDETIIESSLMIAETWSQPDFGAPIAVAHGNGHEVNRDIATSESPGVPREVGPLEYLKVQSVIPHTTGMSKSWYEQKVLRQIDREMASESSSSAAE